MIADDLDRQIDDTLDRLGDALDALSDLRERLREDEKAAKRAYATAMLDAIAGGARNAEERRARADLASIDLAATAAYTEREYRDTLTAIRVHQATLDVLRSTMVTQRQVQV